MDQISNRIPFSRWKPIEIMLAILFLIAPFYYHPNTGGQGLRIPNNITVWMVATIIIFYSLFLILKSPKIFIPKQFIYILSFPLSITLIGFITGIEQPIEWLFRLLFIWGGLAFFICLFQFGVKQGRLDRILYVIVISGLLQGLVGVAQIWLKLDMPFWLPRSQTGTPSGLFQQINNMATYQVTVIMIALYLITRPFLTRGKLWIQLISIITVAVAGFLVAISGSRIGALTLTLGLLILISSLWRRFKLNKKLTRLILFALVAGIISGITSDVIKGNSHLVDKTIAMQSGYSGSARLGIYAITFVLFKQEPVFGHGIGSFGELFQYYRPQFYAEHPDAVLPNQYVSHPHNEILFWLLEGGVISVIGLLAFLLGASLAIIKIGWQRGGSYAAMLLPVGLHTQVELPLYMSAVHWFTLIMLLFLINNHNVETKTIVLSSAMIKFIKVFSVLMFMSFTFFFLHTIRSNWDFVHFYRGEQRVNPMPYAYQNPYFAEQARWIDMSSIMYSSMHYGKKENIWLFITWAERKLIERPDIDLYIKLMDAYQFLDDKGNYCKTVVAGFLIYPQAERFKEAMKFC